MRSAESAICFPVKTPLGVFYLEETKKGLRRVFFPGRRRGKKSHSKSVCGKKFVAYFRDPHRNWKLRLDLSGVSEFDRKVYEALLRVKPGQVIGYEALAAKAGYPKASRAVGSAMRRNRLPIVVPCHRVVPKSGGLGNYSGGVVWKKRLLEHERVKIR